MIVLILALLAIAVYYIVPPVVGKAMLCSAAKDAGFQEKSITVDGHTVCYLEGSGKGETVLLLHGFGARKEDWLVFAPGLIAQGFHVVIPDLPGFGESTKNDNASYSVSTQAKRMQEFATALQIKEMHIAGNSLGAAIAGKLAASNPEMVRTLSLFDAACVAGAKPSETQELIKQGKNVFTPKSRQEMATLLDLVFTNKPAMPFLLMEYLTRDAIADGKFREKIMYEIWGQEKYALEDDAGKIKAKTLILWGDNDRLTDISGAGILKDKIQNSQIVIITNCGHAPMLEKPAETMAAFLNFIRE